MPALVDYENIKEVTLISKHRVNIKHKGASMLYILDAESFYEELIENMKEYKKSVNH